MPHRIRFYLTAVMATVALGLSFLAASVARAEPITAQDFRPTVIPLSAPEVSNPMRGQYAWLGAPSQVEGWPMRDIYYRDQLYWGRVEQQRGRYDFTWFDNGVRRAAETQGRFGFRVMAYCPYCWMNSRTDFPTVVPEWMPVQPGTANPDNPTRERGIPDWNSEVFLSSWEGLMTALGDRYRDDPRLGWVDVGGYGAYGEWHGGGRTPITRANAQRMIRAVLTNFPEQHVIMHAMDPTFTSDALTLSPRMGMRTDCLGAPDMYSLFPTWGTRQPSLTERWKTAPILAEWCSSADFVLGAEQVRTWHITQISSGNFRTPYAERSTEQQAAFRSAMTSSGYRYVVDSVKVPGQRFPRSSAPVSMTIRNVGVAPTYDPWSVRLQLRRADGTVAATMPLTADLRTHLPGTRTHSQLARVPSVPPGTYTLALVVADPDRYLPPMNLAIQGRTADGAYPLGAVRVAASVQLPSLVAVSMR